MFLRVFVFSGFLIAATSELIAQQAHQHQRKTDPDATYLETEPRIRAMLRRVDLTPAQRGQVEPLLAVYAASMAAENDPEMMKQRVLDIEPLAHELLAARQAGDTAREEELKRRLEEMVPGYEQEKELFEGVDEILTPEQKTELKFVRAQIEKRTGDCAMWPIDVVRIAQKLSLSAEQERSLDVLLGRFRETVAARGRLTKDVRVELLEQLIGEIRGLLTEEQRPRFDHGVGLYRL